MSWHKNRITRVDLLKLRSKNIQMKFISLYSFITYMYTVIEHVFHQCKSHVIFHIHIHSGNHSGISMALSLLQISCSNSCLDKSNTVIKIMICVYSKSHGSMFI